MSMLKILIILLSIELINSYDWSAVENTINNFINNGSFPGCVLGIANGTDVLYKQSFGHF